MATLDAHPGGPRSEDRQGGLGCRGCRSTAGYSLTIAPLAYKGMIIVATRAPSTASAARRRVQRDRRKQVWAVLDDPRHRLGGKWSPTTWEGRSSTAILNKEKADFAKYQDAWQRGGGSTWMTPAVDPETDTLFIVVGNPSPDLDGETGPGPTPLHRVHGRAGGQDGEIPVHYQYVPHDVSGTSTRSGPAVLFETTVDGRRVKAVGHAGKTGLVLTSTSGRRQRLIRKSQAFVPQENMFAPADGHRRADAPWSHGGSEWSPVAYSPDTQMVYVLGLHQP